MYYKTNRQIEWKNSQHTEHHCLVISWPDKNLQDVASIVQIADGKWNYRMDAVY